MNAFTCLATLLVSLSATSATQASDRAGDAPWLVYSELPRAGDSMAIVAARPGARVELGRMDVLPGVEPFARLSPEGRALFIARHRDLNHPERSATLYRFDLATRRLVELSDTADGAPPLPLGPRSVAWIETHQIHPVDEARLAEGELFTVEQSIQAHLDGEQVELARLDHIYGAHLAGLSEHGIVLYVVSREEAAFYLLPLSGAQIDRAAGPIRQPRGALPRDKVAIESRLDSSAPSGLARLARAPAGPFARDFSVSGDTLFFGTLSADRRTQALYALDLTIDDLERVRNDETTRRTAQLLESTGETHPEPLACGDALFFTRADGTAADRRLITHVELASTPRRALPAIAEAMAHARHEWESSSLRTPRHDTPSRQMDDRGVILRRREILRVRGQARVLAADPEQDVLVLQRRFAPPGDVHGERQTVELLWIDAAHRSATPLVVDGHHRVFGFAEVTP